MANPDVKSPSSPAQNGAVGLGSSGARETGELTSDTSRQEGIQSQPRSGTGETTGEKIGSFFRRAVDRISGNDEDRLTGTTRVEERDREHRFGRDTLERSEAGDTSWQSGNSSFRGGQDRGGDRSAWKDLGRSRDDRNASYRAGSPGDTGGGYERLGGGNAGASMNPGYGQGTTGRPYGQGQGSFGGQSDVGQGYGQAGGQTQGQSYGHGSPFSQGERGAFGQGDRGRRDEQRGWRDDQTFGEQSLGRSRSSGTGFGDAGFREESRDRGFEQRGSEHRGSGSEQSGAAGMGAAYAGTGAGLGFGRDEERSGWGKTSGRDEERQRRFWQKEPLSARDVMTRNPKTVTPSASLQDVATIMRDENCGAVPVVDGSGRLQGIVTDRDIVVRSLVKTGPSARIEEAMTDDVAAVTEDEPLTSVLDLMGRKQVRRVPVVDRNDRLLGIISMADIATRADYDEDLQDAFERISSRRSFWSLFS